LAIYADASSLRVFLKADPLQEHLDRRCSYSSSPIEAQWKDYYAPQGSFEGDLQILETLH
jgi:hypothetical protein